MENTITVNGEEYQKVIPGGCFKAIVIIDNRGLMFVGDLASERNKDGMCIMKNARCIIRWGTKNHFAELVNGCNENTKLGAAADMVFTPILIMPVKAEKWDV